jgi:DNA repair protein RecN (Recombination protein N)
VIAKALELRAELDGLTGRDTKLVELAAARTKAEAAAVSAAGALGASRKQAARKLEKDVGAALAELGMGSARLTVVVEPRALGPTGCDRVELMLASNKGEDTRPLAKVASGGELSRIMLALKLSLRRADEVATYVFDEVDTGIGGATAQVVGSQIRRVAGNTDGQRGDPGRQVLCVTHLPQIAAYADHHFQVEKAEVAGRTETHVRKLSAAARKDELARMLGGHATSKAKAHAAELLAEAARSAATPPKKPSARA